MKFSCPITFVILLLLVTLASPGLAQDDEQIELAQQYDDKGEVEKAKSIYDKLADKKKYVPIIHGRYFRLLMNNGYQKDAEKYLNKVLKIYPDNIIYRLDAGILQQRLGDDQEAESYFQDVRDDLLFHSQNQDQFPVQKSRRWLPDHFLPGCLPGALCKIPGCEKYYVQIHRP